MPGRRKDGKKANGLVILPDFPSYRLLKFKIPGHSRNDREQRNLPGFHFQIAIRNIAFLVKIDKVGIQSTVGIINTKYPITAELLFSF